MIKNITREIEPKIDKVIKIILLLMIVNLLFSTLINNFFTQWIINIIFCALVLYELFILNKNLDFIYLLDIKKEDIYNNLMINYFKISIILLSFTYIVGVNLFNGYYLGMSLMLPIFIFITSFLLEFLLTRKKTSIIKYILVATVYLFLIYYLNVIFWISISYLFIKANSFIILQKKDYKFIKNNLFLNFSILFYSSMFVFLYPTYNYYYDEYQGERIIYLYNFRSLLGYSSIVLFLLGIFIVFIIYYYFKKNYNLKAKNKFIDLFFLTLTYILLIIKLFSLISLLKYDILNNITLTIVTITFSTLLLLVLIFISSKINFNPKKLREMYDKYL